MRALRSILAASFLLATACQAISGVSDLKVDETAATKPGGQTCDTSGFTRNCPSSTADRCSPLTQGLLECIDPASATNAGDTCAQCVTQCIKGSVCEGPNACPNLASCVSALRPRGATNAPSPSCAAHLCATCVGDDAGSCDGPPGQEAVRACIAGCTCGPAACDDGGASFDLTIAADAFLPHGGNALHVALVDHADQSLQACDSTCVSADIASWEIHFAGRMTAGHDYDVIYYADQTADAEAAHNAFGTPGVCDPPPKDHAWLRTITNVHDHVFLHVKHDQNWLSNACDYFTPASP